MMRDSSFLSEHRAPDAVVVGSDRSRRDAEVQRLLDLYLCATWTARDYQAAVDGGRRDVAAKLAQRMVDDQRTFELQLRQTLRANL
jgi:flagellar biosynthesis regulator FlaF